MKTMFPGWAAWVYTNPRGRENVLCPLLRDYPFLYICDVTNLPSLGDVTSIHNMIWRALPLGDAKLSAFFVRDSDALVSSTADANAESEVAICCHCHNEFT